MPDNPLEGVDAPRKMPADLRSRIERELLAAAPLPHQARARIATSLTDQTKALFDGIDGPRPLPDRTRRRLERSLAKPVPVPEPRWLSSRRWLAIAAVVTLVLASVSAITNRPGSPRGQVGSTAMDASGTDDGLVSEGLMGSGSGAGVGDPGFAPSESATAGGVQAATPQSGYGPIGPTGGSAAYSRRANGPPPFALSDEEGLATFSDMAPGASMPDDGGSPDPGPTTTTTAPPPPPPFRISVATGDATGVAGFNAYVELLNRYGGAGGRRFVIVKDGDPADVKVNLSGTASTAAAGTAQAITIDSLLAPDRILRGNTFGFAGAVDRQAHLIADAVYPAAAGGTAVIYREQAGVLHDEVPAALEAVLRQRGLTTVVVDVRPNEAVVPVPTADSVFLSVTAANAKRVVDAYPSNSRPPRGFNGIGTLAESGAVPGLPVGTRFISPYAFPDSKEAKRVQELTKLPPGARLYHGWIVAKTLAVAVWRFQPHTTDQLRGSLDRMNGYANGFAPAYTYRHGTHSVRPEGVLFEVDEAGATQKGDFLTDPRP